MKKARNSNIYNIYTKKSLIFYMSNLLMFIFLIFCVNSLKDGKNRYIFGTNDILLFLTKDGYLSSYRVNKRANISHIWKIHLGNNLSFPNNSYIITKDISTQLINEKLYIIKENKLIPFNVFINELVNNSNYVYDKDIYDCFLKGNIKKSYLTIDLNEGKILEEKDNINIDDSYIKKKLEKNNKNIIILKREEYNLKKVDKKSKKVLINLTIDDISLVNNSNNHINLVDKNNVDKLIGELKIEIDIKEIISIFSYSYKNKKIDLLYNNNIFDKNNSNKRKMKLAEEKDIKELIKENNSELFHHLNNIYELLSLKLYNYNIFNTILILSCSTIILMVIYKFMPKTKTININNTSIINENYSCKNMNSENVTNFSTKSLEICHSIENLYIKPVDTNKSNDEKNTQLVKYCPNKFIDIMNNFSESKTVYKPGLMKCHSTDDLTGRTSLHSVEYNDIENNDINNNLKEQKDYFEIIDNNIMKKINNSDIEKIIEPIKNEYKFKNIKVDPLTKEIYVNIEKSMKQKITLKMQSKKFEEYKNILLFETKLLTQQEQKNLEEEKVKSINLKGIEESKKSSSKKGIWEDSISESLEEEEINTSNHNANINNINIRSINFNERNKLEENLEIKAKESTISDELNETKIIKKVKSRLDQDFKNLEKIGEGGFGIVLKGVHRLDKGVNAIKIIKLSSINDKENIINEAITMTRISSKHIVQYKTCWIDNLLGSAKKFFDEVDSDDDNDNSNTNLDIKSKSKSIIIKKKRIENISITEAESSEEDEYNSIALKRNKSKDILNIKNKENNSQESKKIKRKNTLAKYYNDYRDDSYMEQESIISKKYNKNNNLEITNDNYSTNSHCGKYFFILMEYCDGLTLEKYIQQHANSSIERKIIYSFTLQLLKSLSKIHSGGIIHRDIKPSNIFIKNDQIKIGDFGLATRYNSSKLLKSKKLEGTPLYLSPEQIAFKTYNEKVDIYACGITLYEMCSCFYTAMERYESINNLKNNQILEERVCKNYPEETELIKLMTVKDYNERPSANDILKSDLFVNLGKKLGY